MCSRARHSREQLSNLPPHTPLERDGSIDPTYKYCLPPCAHWFCNPPSTLFRRLLVHYSMHRKLTVFFKDSIQVYIAYASNRRLPHCHGPSFIRLLHSAVVSPPSLTLLISIELNSNSNLHQIILFNRVFYLVESRPPLLHFLIASIFCNVSNLTVRKSTPCLLGHSPRVLPRKNVLRPPP